MTTDVLTSYAHNNNNKIKSNNYALILLLFCAFVITAYISAPICCIISYAFAIYFVVKNDCYTLRYFVSFVVIQNLVLIICANRMSSTWVTLFTLSKEVMIYGCVLKRIIVEHKIKKKNFVFVVYFLMVVLSFLSSNVAIYSRIVSLRQMLLPIICFAFGYGLRVERQHIKNVSNYIIGLSVLVAIIGYLEFFILRDTVWHMLPIYQFQVNKGTTFKFYNDVPLNFYTWDLFDTFHIVVRRLVSTFADPLITGHFLLLGFVLASSFIENKNRKGVVKIILAIAIILTMSKGSIICLFIYEFMIIGRRVYRKLLVNNPLVLLGLGVLAIFVASYFANALPTSSIGTHLNGLLKGFSNGSLLGKGLGNAGVITGILSDSEDLLAGESYIGVLISQMGYVGFILFFAAFVKMIVECYRNSFFDNYLSYKVGSLMFGLLFECLFSESSIGIVATGLYFIYAGLVMREGEGSTPSVQ